MTLDELLNFVKSTDANYFRDRPYEVTIGSRTEEFAIASVKYVDGDIRIELRKIRKKPMKLWRRR